MPERPPGAGNCEVWRLGSVLAFEDDVDDIGPLLYASVDAGLTVVIGQNGTTRFPTPVIERVEWPDIIPALDIVRAPDDADEIPLYGVPMIADAPRVEPIERLTPAYVAALMRHKVEGRDGQPLSGGGGGRRRTKPPKRQPIREVVQDEKPGEVTPRFKVVGLTRGEEEFFLRRPGEDLRVARETVGELIRGTFADPPVRPQFGMRYNFSIYGLDELQLRILARFRGVLRRALIQHAHTVDGPRVKAIDGR